MIYGMLKNLIEAKRYEQEDMQNKLDVFFTFDRITAEQYAELNGMIAPVVEE